MTVATKERVIFRVVASRNDLLAVVGRVRGVVERRSTIPILTNLKLAAADGRLSVTGTDLDIEATDSIPCAGEGATTVNADQLGGLLAKMPSGAECELVLVGAEPRMAVKCGRSTYRLNVLPVGDFPSISDAGLGEPLTLATGDIETLIEKTAFAMSTESTRFYLCGAHLHVVGSAGAERLRMVATNGHMLALAEIDAPADGAAPVTIPAKTIREIGRFLDAAGETVTVRLSPQKIQVSAGSWVLTSKVIDGDYPPYERVIPSANATSVTINRGLLIDALGRLRTVADDKSKAVKLELSEGHLRITIRTRDGTEGDEEIEADFAGEPLIVGFNADYLLETLGRIEDANVEIRLGESRAGVTADPALVLDPSNPRVQFVLVPLRA